DEIYLNGLSGVLPTMPMTFQDLEARAQPVLSPSALSYVAGGAGVPTSGAGCAFRLAIANMQQMKRVPAVRVDPPSSWLVLSRPSTTGASGPSARGGACGGRRGPSGVGPGPG